MIPKVHTAAGVGPRVGQEPKTPSRASTMMTGLSLVLYSAAPQDTHWEKAGWEVETGLKPSTPVQYIHIASSLRITLQYQLLFSSICSQMLLGIRKFGIAVETLILMPVIFIRLTDLTLVSYYSFPLMWTLVRQQWWPKSLGTATRCWAGEFWLFQSSPSFVSIPEVNQWLIGNSLSNNFKNIFKSSHYPFSLVF